MKEKKIIVKRAEPKNISDLHNLVVKYHSISKFDHFRQFVKKIFRKKVNFKLITPDGKKYLFKDVSGPWLSEPTSKDMASLLSFTVTYREWEPIKKD